VRQIVQVVLRVLDDLSRLCLPSQYNIANKDDDKDENNAYWVMRWSKSKTKKYFTNFADEFSKQHGSSETRCPPVFFFRRRLFIRCLH